MPLGLPSCRLGPPLIAALLFAGPVHAQIVTDGSVGPKVSLSGSSVDIGANLGTQSGDNLFHSFEKFGITTGQTAAFTGPGTIKNVISRVTGGEISNIDGVLKSEVGQAGFYFLNPAGVLFGPNARIAVPGSFHVSTAHELRFADGVSFSALDKSGSGLTVAAPEAFGFLDRSPGQIKVERSRLQLGLGKTFSLVGGDITVNGTGIAVAADGIESVGAQEGTVNLASITGPGRFRISDGAVEATAQGNIQLADGAEIAANGNGGGNVRIRGGVLTLQTSSIQAENTGELNSAGNIDIQAGEVRMSTGGNISTRPRSSGNAGNITLNANSLTLSDSSIIQSDASESAAATGAGGRITVTATDNIEIVGGSKIGNNTNSSARPGTVTVQANSLTLFDASSINSDAFAASTGGPGDVIVTVTGTLKLHNNSNIRSETLSITPSSGGEPRSGERSALDVTAGTIEVRRDSGIRSNTYGREDAGSVSVHADYLLIDGTSSEFSTGITSDAGYSQLAGGQIGNAGNIIVNAHRIDLVNGGTIQTETWGGKGGTIDVKANHLVISGLGNTGILSRARRHSRTGNAAIGDAGSITVRADRIELRDSGGIRTDTQSTGKGGTVTIIATDSLLIVGRADTGEMITDADSGITSGASAGSVGNAGNVTVEARELVVRGGGLPPGAGRWSDVGISSATAADSHGNAGLVTVSGDFIDLAKRGSISTESAGNGTGGTIQITARDTFQLDDAEIRARTTTEQGGDVTLAVGRLFNLRNSRVTTSVATGGGSGGNIQIKSPLMVLGNSEITSNAKGGSGGNIFIDAGQLIRTPDSKITASGSVNGNITIAAPNTDVSSSLTVLPETFLDASTQLRVACAARGGRPASSFTPGGRGGLPPDPGAPLVVSPSGQPLKQQTATGSPTTSTPRPTQAVKPMTVSGIPQPVLGSPRLTCRG